jgi:hypothetical protein
VPAGGEQTIAGIYVCSWNSVALGMTGGDNELPTLEKQTFSEPIQNTSTYGKTRIDDILQGANHYMSMTGLEYAKCISAFYPFAASLGLMGLIGGRAYDLAQPLVLTAVPGSSAASLPASLTASKAILMPGITDRLMYGPTLRKVPLRFILYPYTSAGNVYWFTQT